MTPMLRRWLPTISLITLALIALAWVWTLNPAHEERDVIQERLDKASAPLVPGRTIGQTFTSQHAGLKAVEVLLALYEDPKRQLPPSARVLCTLQRLGEPEAGPITVEISAVGLKHNQRLRFSFSPLADSAQNTYRFTLSSAGDYGLGFWHTTTEAYADGEMLANVSPPSGDLYFVTAYDYHLQEILRDLLTASGRLGRYLPGLLITLFLPGFVLSLYCLPASRLDAGVYVALVMALSLSIWPLALLWSTVLGIRWGNRGAWVVTALFLLAGLYWGYRAHHRRREVRAQRGSRRPGGLFPSLAWDPLPDLALVTVVLAALATRLLEVRELVVPAWVDSVHHTLITQLISEQGMVPSSYQPYMPAGVFFYHYGFHANAAMLTWLSGLAPYQAVLLLGQILNAGAVLGVYALAAGLTRRRWAGVGAAVVAGALSNMPAYYVSWGRYTQLTGLFLLPLVCVVTMWLLEARATERALWIVGAILVAGLEVIHYRVLVFYALFWLSYWPLLGWRRLRGRGPRQVAVARWGVEMMRSARTALILAGLALLLTLPWAGRLLLRVVPNVGTVYGGWAASEGYNAFPVELIRSGWTRPLLCVAGAGAVWGLLRRQGKVQLLVGWVGWWFLAANLHLLGLRDIWLIHNSSVVISLWLPVSILCGWLAADLSVLLMRILSLALRSLPWRSMVSTALFAAACILVARGSWQLVDIVNPTTILVTPDDLRAIRWAQENIPADARVLINTRKWMGEVRMGADAGWWLSLLAKRQTTMPSVLYAVAPSYFEEVNDLARTVEEAPSLDDPALLARLKDEGITHVFVGARGGRLMPQELEASPHYRLLYSSGPARVYAFTDNAGAQPCPCLSGAY